MDNLDIALKNILEEELQFSSVRSSVIEKAALRAMKRVFELTNKNIVIIKIN